MIPTSVRAAIREGSTGQVPPLDDVLAAWREDRQVIRLLPSAHLEVLLEAAADRLEVLTGPTIEMPIEVREIGQCTANVHLGEGVSRCLRLEHGEDTPHCNGDLRWTGSQPGAVQAWMVASPFTETTLGQLIREQGLVLTLPHLPAEMAEAIRPEPGQLSIGTGPTDDPEDRP